MLGEQVRALVDEKQEAGRHSVVWDGTNKRGLPETSGVYLVRLQTPSFQAVRKMSLLK